MVKEIKDEEFENIIKENDRVVIDCYASWCGPCKMLSPIIDSLSSELSEIKFYKINVDESSLVTSKYEIMSIPTLLVFEKGELKDRIVGFKSKSELKDLLN